ncbi:TOM1-like protein 6 [Rhododendron vialii]|uniref:TOM1-like protein 6 n=1 Tax=Rhododendron vialii TaxID=182163 RepID=UPI00265FB3E0|nr:TOM1-like protein 6 [Rhododendron vialii]
MMMASSSSSSSSATVRVDKATSDLLIGPDWTMNMDICDSINSNHWEAKEVVKAVKKRLQHKNPKVHLLALTLLETMVKNCGDNVHFQIAERNILQDMTKIVKKKTDMHVRDKILVLLDSWQEAFGGPGGKYPQYYWAYEELRRAGVLFPQRSPDAAPIFTPPVVQSTLRHPQAGYGMPINSSTRLDEAMAAETENLSLSSINSMRDVLDLLADMLQAVNPSDRTSVKDEIIVDLVNQCRSNQKKLMQMLTTTGDEELLGQGLELNDSLQTVLAKHDAIASGSTLPTQAMDFNPRSAAESSLKPADVNEPSQEPVASPSLQIVPVGKSPIEEDEDEEDDFAQLARRHSRTRSTASQDTSTGTGESITSVNSTVIPVPSNALALPDPPAPVRTTKEQDMIDLLSLTLSTTTPSPQTPNTPASSSQNVHQAPPLSPTTQGYPYPSQAYTGNQGQVPYNSNYVVPWAQPQAQVHPQPYLRPQHQPQAQAQVQPQPYLHPQSQAQSPQPQPYLQPQPLAQPQPPHPHPQAQYLPYSSGGYPPPPWAPTPGYYSNQPHSATSPYMNSSPRANTPASVQGARPSQNINSFPAKESNGLALNGETRPSSSPRTTATLAGQKPFVPSYRLFEDLNVLGNGDGRFKMSTTSGGLSGASSQSQSMVGGRK